MDVLTEAVQSMHTGPPAASRTEAHAPFGLRFPPVSGAGFHVVLEGSCWLVSENSAPMQLSTGDIVFLRDGGVHALADAPGTPQKPFAPERVELGSPIGVLREPGPGPRTVLLCGAYLLDTAHPHPLVAQLPPVIHLPSSRCRDHSLRATVDLLRSEVEGLAAGADGVVAALIDAMLVYVLRAWWTGQGGQGWALALTDPGIAPALKAIHGDPAQAWTVDTLGGCAGMSRAAFARKFTELVGEPPLSYLTRWRMTLAARRLRDGDARLAVISRDVGYTSEFAFARAFKRSYGVAPGAYRRAASA